jgi:hypothetical protein
MINGTGGRATGGGLGPGGISGGGVSGAGGFSAGGVNGAGGIGVGRTCAGATNPTGTLCRTAADCTGAGGAIGGFGPWYCYMTVPPRGCGNPSFLPQQCNWPNPNGSNCPDGGVCQTIECGGHICVAPCDPSTCTGTKACVSGFCTDKRCDEPGAAPCAAGFECKPTDPTASTLGCVPSHCTTASDCGDGYDCSATAPGKGCVHRACTVDTDCACGYCVNSFCEATPGFCYQIVATPYGCVWPDEELV